MIKSDPAASVLALVNAEPASAVPTGSVFGRLSAASCVRNCMYPKTLKVSFRLRGREVRPDVSVLR